MPRPDPPTRPDTGRPCVHSCRDRARDNRRAARQSRPSVGRVRRRRIEGAAPGVPADLPALRRVDAPKTHALSPKHEGVYIDHSGHWSRREEAESKQREQRAKTHRRIDSPIRSWRDGPGVWRSTPIQDRRQSDADGKAARPFPDAGFLGLRFGGRNRFGIRRRAGDGEALPLRGPRRASNSPRRLRERLQLRPPAQEPEGPHAPRVRVQNLDKGVASIQHRSNPSIPGTKHLDSDELRLAPPLPSARARRKPTPRTRSPAAPLGRPQPSQDRLISPLGDRVKIDVRKSSNSDASPYSALRTCTPLSIRSGSAVAQLRRQLPRAPRRLRPSSWPTPATRTFDEPATLAAPL